MTWERTPLGLETAPPVSRAARAGSREAGKTLKSPLWEAPALHREADRDTTGILTVSPTYIRGSAILCKGAVAPKPQSYLFGG